MKCLNSLFALAFLSALFNIQTATAAHLVGGQLSYECLGDNTYSIQLLIYRDCNCVNCAQFDNPAHITVFDGENNFVQVFDIFDPTIVEIPADTDELCVEDAPDVCVEEGNYQIEVTLPPSSNGYQLVYQRCCRNNTIDNLIDPGAQGSTYSTPIPALSGDCNNSSPTFDNFPPIIICANSPLIFDHAATDIDGDQLVYSICEPLQGADQNNPYPDFASNPPYDPVNWAAGFDANNPLSSDPQMVIDPETGMLEAYPTNIGQFVVGVCVSEYRDGELLGTYIRDFQFNVADCAIVEAIAEVAIVGEDTICLGESVQLIGQTFSADGWFWTPSNTLNDDESLTPIATPSQTTTYTLTAFNTAAQCGAETTVTIVVIDPLTANAGEDQTFCPGQTVQLNGSGGDLYEWSPTTGLSDPNIANPVASPSQNTTYVLTVSDSSQSCFDTDEVTVFVGTSGDPGDMPDDQIILCDGESTNLTASNVSLEPGSILGYILHTSPNDQIGTVVASGSTGVFALNSSPNILANTVYYVSSVAGPEGDTPGVPDLSNGCTRIAPGTPVVFLLPLELRVDEYCDWNALPNGIFYLAVHPTGGYPAYDPTALYQVSGEINQMLPPGGSAQTSIEGSQSTQSYDFTLTDGTNCVVEKGNTFICYKTPVELLSFTGKATANGNLIQWVTASEFDNDYFTLERSANGQQFATITTVPGAGTSTTQLYYNYLDKNAPQGKSYYRLRQTDYNGSTSLSEIISVGQRSTVQSSLTASPIPAAQSVQFAFTSSSHDAQAILLIRDVTGKTIYQQTLSVQEGNNTASVNVEQMPAGLYFATLQTKSKTESVKWVKE